MKKQPQSRISNNKGSKREGRHHTCRRAIRSIQRQQANRERKAQDPGRRHWHNARSMSREERKMAQIIASIERMEQRKAATPSSASSSRTDSTGESDGNASSSNTKSTAATLQNQEHRPKMERMNSSEIHAQVQKSTRLGAKGKKPKPLSTSHSGGSGGKVRSGSKKVKTPQELVVNKREIIDCKLTPKKRWIQLWNEQLSSDDSADGDRKEQQEPEKEPLRETIVKDQMPITTDSVELKAAAKPKPARPTITQEEDPAKEEGEADDDDEEGAVKVTQVKKATVPSSPQADEQKEASISPVSSVKESSKDAAAAARSSKPIPSVDSRRVPKNAKSSKKAVAPVSSDSDETEKLKGGKAATVSASDSDANLRVKSPQVVESSHLSPPLDHNSPAVAASISPSAKTKDAEPNSAEASCPSEKSVQSPLGAREAKASPNSPIPKKSMTEAISKARESSHDRSRKRSLERKESEPLTEEEKRRAERRRKRKSNWDVGDPRFASRDGEKQSVRSPSSDDNSKFPPGRPSWRHSMSMDATHSSNKSSFQNNSNSGSHRSSFSGGSNGPGPVRRGFYQSTSLPLDRSRSAGRSSSSRYNYGNGSYR